MKVYGYARCSTNKIRQDMSRQIMYLIYECNVPKTNIVSEYRNKYQTKKCKLYNLLHKMPIHSHLYITEFDRLTRDVRDATYIFDILVNKNITLHVNDSVLIEFSSNMDPIYIEMFYNSIVRSACYLKLLSKHIKLGLNKARSDHVKIGRPKVTYLSLPDDVKLLYPKYKKGEINKSQYARMCNISYPSIYKYICIIENHRKKV